LIIFSYYLTKLQLYAVICSHPHAYFDRIACLNGCQFDTSQPKPPPPADVSAEKKDHGKTPPRAVANAATAATMLTTPDIKTHTGRSSSAGVTDLSKVFEACFVCVCVCGGDGVICDIPQQISHEISEHRLSSSRLRWRLPRNARNCSESKRYGR
jgi:hypothetical protein